jgi:hypothetical protein
LLEFFVALDEGLTCILSAGNVLASVVESSTSSEKKILALEALCICMNVKAS